MMQSFITNSDKQTKDLAKTFAKKFESGIIALSGGLGTGKTMFVQGFAQGLGIKEKITSPSFVLIRQHKIPNTKKLLYHIDLYRLEKMEDIKHTGIEEIINNPNNVVLIEWADKIKKLLPITTTWIHFEVKGKDQREITIK